ncbi:MAG: peptidase T [Mobilibacterium timonense]|uniref:peptidase T n=1 Tax=Mobilibacterium timonense TaxID=1871012 RepID=UPI0023534744|nr:peptidase T [Mobilibacterium timonense]MBM6990953.1 peptidase T [Mobilibacterium timonense]
MKAYERLLKYVVVRTPSDENSDTHPSSQCQFDLGNMLVEELHELGVSDAAIDEHCYVYGHIPATPGLENKTPIGFIAHMDTVSDFCDHDIKPVIHENYDGGSLALGNSGRSLEPSVFPHLPSLKGRTLITSDGTTVLGADDKAGIAEIMTAIQELSENNIPHGPLSIAFTPDEEIGAGTYAFDVERFGAKYAYTLDGDQEGELQYETFNAAMATVEFKGESVHPGSAKDIMINAALVAMEFDSLLPAAERPERTEDHEGFYHLIHSTGSVSEAKLTYILRDHDSRVFQDRHRVMEHAAKFLNEKYGEGRVKLTIKEQYKNMSEVIEKYPEITEKAKAAIRDAGMEPAIIPVRGGTDGAQLSFMGLPCPNLGTGGHAYHGPFEHITVEGMDKSVEILVALIKEFAK